MLKNILVLLLIVESCYAVLLCAVLYKHLDCNLTELSLKLSHFSQKQKCENFRVVETPPLASDVASSPLCKFLATHLVINVKTDKHALQSPAFFKWLPIPACNVACYQDTRRVSLSRDSRCLPCFWYNH